MKMMKNKLKEICLKKNIEFCGITNTEKGSVLVCLFPYYTGNHSGNLSKYAVVCDYHTVCGKYLSEIAETIPAETEVYADISPFNEVLLAQKAGLGIIGESGLLINPKYGSYVFIGCILIKNIFLEEDLPMEGFCKKCGLCKKNCPLGALQNKNMSLCLSEISQKRGELTLTEQKALRENGLIWGCDICSDVCPHNKDIPITPIKEFTENIKESLKYDEISGLSNREFKEKYKNRAFNWRGRNVLIRNLEIFDKK